MACSYFKGVVNIDELNYPVSFLSQSFPVWSAIEYFWIFIQTDDAWRWGRDSTKCWCVNSWKRIQAKSISLLLISMLERNFNQKLCFLSKLRNTSQPTMIFFYYNLVANSQPQTSIRVHSFCSKKGLNNFCFIVFLQNYARIIKEFNYAYIKVKYQEIIEARSKNKKIIMSEQRTITRSTKI